ncbi:MAG: sugar ABC transporter ATP-binding protein [Octadecabacter sp.]|nr:sugar ABC transporter ATP-binding protein [Octadecabacter sp.]
MSKAYGAAKALDGVDLSLIGGQVHALMGENGAGKSTLIKLLAGVVPADELTAKVDNADIALTSAQDAQWAGFRFIHQELNIVPQVSVAENMLLGRTFPRRFGLAVNWQQVHARALEALAFLGADHIDVRALAGDLNTGDRMLMKIAAAFVSDSVTDERAVLYVLDEPTAALTSAESELLFDVIARLAATGAVVLYVSHRIDEVLRICDAVTVLRDGRLVSSGPTAETDKAQIIRDMTGRDVADAYPAASATPRPDVIVAMESVSAGPLLGINFELRAGEVIGIAGLANAGQGAVLETFMGLHSVRRGVAQLRGKPLPRSPEQAWRRGVAYLPKERRSEGLMLNMSIRANIALPHLTGVQASTSRERQMAETLSSQMRLKCEHLDQPVTQLSGGNQQKVLFARALHGLPDLLLLDEPTRGVDVGAKYDIYCTVREASAKGCAVLMTSSDLPELLGMCDRILVLHNRRQAHMLECDGLTSSDLLSHFYEAKVA